MSRGSLGGSPLDTAKYLSLPVFFLQTLDDLIFPCYAGLTNRLWELSQPSPTKCPSPQKYEDSLQGKALNSISKDPSQGSVQICKNKSSGAPSPIELLTFKESFRPPPSSPARGLFLDPGQNDHLTFWDPDMEPFREALWKELLVLRRELLSFPPGPFLAPKPLPSMAG